MKITGIVLLVMCVFCLFHDGNSKKNWKNRTKQLLGCRHPWIKVPKRNLCYKAVYEEIEFPAEQNPCESSARLWNIRTFHEHALVYNKENPSTNAGDITELIGSGNTEGSETIAHDGKSRNGSTYWVDDKKTMSMVGSNGCVFVEIEKEVLVLEEDCSGMKKFYGCQKKSVKFTAKSSKWKPKTRKQKSTWEKCIINGKEYWCRKN